MEIFQDSLQQQVKGWAHTPGMSVTQRDTGISGSEMIDSHQTIPDKAQELKKVRQRLLSLGEQLEDFTKSGACLTTGVNRSEFEGRPRVPIGCED